MLKTNYRVNVRREDGFAFFTTIIAAYKRAKNWLKSKYCPVPNDLARTVNVERRYARVEFFIIYHTTHCSYSERGLHSNRLR